MGAYSRGGLIRGGGLFIEQIFCQNISQKLRFFNEIYFSSKLKLVYNNA